METRSKRSHRKSPGLAVAAAIVLAASSALAADPVKVGVIKNAVYGPLFIGEAKGYFAAENLAPELIFFESAPAMAPAVVAGSIDFAAANASGATYNLAGQGALKIIAGFAEDVPGFQLFAVVASKRAYDGGLTSYQGLPGHTVGITALGSGIAYTLTLIETKYHLDPASTRIVPLQSISNMVASVVGGTIDCYIGPVTPIMPAVTRGDVKLLGYSGEEAQWQLGTIYTATKTADTRHDFVARFLGAYRKAVADYDNAFVDASGKRRNGPNAPEDLAIMAKYLGQTPEAIEPALGYVNAEGKLDVADILRQIAWYKSQGMVKPEVDGASFIDKRYVVPLDK
ncbi:MAG TPA: ABC transporter substrate-binding protein [Stellaceae bacterium]|nr:ABC transporter substrate-binding protein [Stellaceae bacterium]